MNQYKASVCVVSHALLAIININKVKSSDFVIAIARLDDIIQTKDKELPTVRDNVIFELGLFMSVLGRDRTFLVVLRNDNVVLPSDFKGLTPLTLYPL